MRALCHLVVLALVAALAACGGPSTAPLFPSPAQRSAPVAPAQVPDPLRGVSAHYVVEMGKNRDGQLQVDIRQMQEPSIFASPMPFTGARIVYPDHSTQRVDFGGGFDAADSKYAAKHGEPIGGPNVTVHIVSLMTIAFEPTTFGIYVPSKRQERLESSASAPVDYTLAANNFPAECKRTAVHEKLDPNDVAAYVFTTPALLGVDFPILLSSCTTRRALGRVNDYLWVKGANRFRYTIRYQAPSVSALKSANIRRAGEYLDVAPSTAAAARLSPRYDTVCSDASC